MYQIYSTTSHCIRNGFEYAKLSPELVRDSVFISVSGMSLVERLITGQLEQFDSPLFAVRVESDVVIV